ncbi:MAG: TA system VapC family ribonuclease toxin [Verrucomicrobiota bacterium]
MTYLYDVNVLLAAFIPQHPFHSTFKAWYLKKGAHAWATVHLTQAGFLRISTNPKVFFQPLSLAQSTELLQKNMEDPRHQIILEKRSFPEVVEPFVSILVSHQQLSDAYLLGICQEHQLKLLTFDLKLKSIPLPEGEEIVEFLVGGI